MARHLGLCTLTLLLLVALAFADSAVNHGGHKSSSRAVSEKNHGSTRPRARRQAAYEDSEPEDAYTSEGARNYQDSDQDQEQEGQNMEESEQAENLDNGAAEAHSAHSAPTGFVPAGQSKGRPVNEQEDVIKALDEVEEEAEQAEEKLENLKQLMRRLRRQESGGVSFLEVQEAASGKQQAFEEGSHERAESFPKAPPETLEAYRAYQICNLTLTKAYKLLHFEITIQTRFGAAGWTAPFFVQDVMEELSAAWQTTAGSGSQASTPSGKFGWGADNFASQNSIDMLTLQKLQVAMGWISLRAALQSGHGIWTSADQSGLTQYCMATQVMNNLEEQQANPSVVQGDIMISRLQSGLWAKGVVPFCFSPGVSTGAKAAFQMAIDHIQAQVPCLTFTHINVNSIKQPPTCIATPSIVVTSASPGCFSYLGQVDLVTGSQIVNLGPGCELMGMAIHQILHAVGMAHEIARSDRNSYLSFNAASTSRTTSTIYPVDYVQGYPIPNRPNNSTDNFDLLSITMPPASTFSGDGFDTVDPSNLPILGRYMGQRHGLSEADAANLATMYSCNSVYPPRTPSWELTTKWLSGVGFALDGKCLDRAYTGVGWRDGLNRNFSFTCTDLRLLCRDSALGVRTNLVCPATCLQCIQPPPSLQIYKDGYGAYNDAQGTSGGLNEYSWKHAPVQW